MQNWRDPDGFTNFTQARTDFIQAGFSKQQTQLGRSNRATQSSSMKRPASSASSMLLVISA